MAMDGLEGVVKVAPDEWAPAADRYDVLHTCSVLIEAVVEGITVHDYFTFYEHELEVLE